MMVRERGENRREDTNAVAPEVLQHRKLVRRSHFLTIIAAWVITVPATAVLAALVFFGLTFIS